MIPYIIIFALSGIVFNHPTTLNNRSMDNFRLSEDLSFDALMPDIHHLAESITDSLVVDGVIINPTLKNVRYDHTMILRNRSTIADYRVQVDIPTSKVQIISLPDFVEDTRVTQGSFKKEGLATTPLLAKLEEILESRGLTPGTSRVQRIPNLVFDLISEENGYRVNYSLQNGNYSVEDLSKRNFKMHYFLVNLHQEHGYPVAGFSVKWLWIFFADALAVLMLVWAISGLIMWIKMKRLFTVGIIVISCSMLLALVIFMSHYELGF